MLQLVPASSSSLLCRLVPLPLPLPCRLLAVPLLPVLLPLLSRSAGRRRSAIQHLCKQLLGGLQACLAFVA